MPRKRQSEGMENDTSPGPSGQVKKKRKILNYDPHEIIHELYDTIRNYKSQDGRVLCEAFIRVPKRRTAADYYDVVSTPIDLLKIQQKVKTDSYDYVDQLSADVLLMINNAKAYYKKSSQEYKDACDLLELYEETRADLVEAVFGVAGRGDRSARRGSLAKELSIPPKEDTDEEESEDEDDDEEEEDDDDDEDEEDDDEADEEEEKNVLSPESATPATPRSTPRERAVSTAEELNDDLEQLFAAIVTTKDGDRDISQAFQLLPQRSKYPQYYEVIQNPVDLKMIATKIQQNRFKSLDDLERDLLLMVKNAKAFNEPKSLIYRDAVTLKRIITERKRELEYKKLGQVKSSERLSKGRDRSVIQRMSAVCASLKYPSEVEDNDGDSSSQFDMNSEVDGGSNGLVEDDPQWILYNFVKNFTDESNDTIADPFLKLPSKKFYPDYYSEIKKPMSLLKIRYKIEMNKYDTMLDLARDFNLMFANAKRYNQDESQIHKDAARLQKAMLEKLRELEPNIMEEVWEELESGGDVDEEDEAVTGEGKEEEDSVAEEEVSVTPLARRGGRKSSIVVNTTPDSEKKRAQKKTADDTLKKRLRTLFSTVYDYSDINGRLLRPIFMVLPSRKDYPDYYQVIMEPVDMTMIETKLKADKYPSEQALLSDLELMFNNARHYNEEGSQVFQDANTLDKVLKAKWKQMSQSTRTPGSRRSKVSESNPLSDKLQDLYESVRDYQDRSGRALSTPFIKLPNKADYPDYYEVIKKPIDMLRIQQKMSSTQYENVEDMVADFVQMFDNACKYNEPESVIYKDALTLQRVCFQKKLDLLSDSVNDVPDVKALTQVLMKNLFIATFNHEDDEGRCYSDSFAELVEKDKRMLLSGEVSEKPLTFDQIKRNLDKERYRRMDRFQEDMFKVFERARKLSYTDSQLYEDAIEMQYFFIKTRDELCKNGELLLTPALSYTEKHLAQDLEEEQASKQEQEKLEQSQLAPEEAATPTSDSIKTGGEATDNATEAGVKMEQEPNLTEECEFNGQIYVKGDFVYINSRDTPEPHIMVIEKFDKDAAGQTVIKGQWFYRPEETYHLATRKFLEKEVFRCDVSHGTPLSEIVGRCCVMFVKEYFKSKPQGIPDKDVYVCESRYSVRHRCITKIKIWLTPQSKNLTFVPREVPLIPRRVASVFADKVNNENVLDDSDTVIDKLRVSVPVEMEHDDGNTYYDQFVCDLGCFKLGDGVYINNPNGQPVIARIDKIWTDNAGEAFFHYASFLRPEETEHPLTRLFYKKEVFQAALEDCALIKNIVGKCYILHMKDYCASRPTEVPETDVYINESKYMEQDKSIKRQKLLKKYTLSQKVVDDEVYFFRKPINLEKEPSPLLMKQNAEDNLFVETEDSLGAEPEASNDGMSVTNDAPSPAPTKSHKKKPVNPRRQPSGYIVFAGEIRKQISLENPNCSFGDISKIVGTKWRALAKTDKDVYEEKARKVAEEMAAKQQEADKALNDSLRAQSPASDAGGQNSQQARHAAPSGFSPHRHVPSQGMHSQVYNGMQSPPHSGYHHSPQGHHPIPYMNGYHSPPPHFMGQGYQQCPPSPVFVSVPPRAQKLMHSEAYIRYIEGLTTDSHSISNWNRELSATQENTPVIPESNLPGDWLSQGAGAHGSVTNALWALRDFMLKDTLSIARTVPFDDL
ncbi:protein polybromo-1 [Elysia marginata]|uniref:Protein polybromo-1 n=1 Tax=Elysia marginata TaxID=1093978 RepID=A0AAV4JED3_9GAST|nr:protein polybromo-1 [Elysia marginata]